MAALNICLSTPNTLGYPDGGHLWVFLNWALGFQTLGHRIIWLDIVDNSTNSPRQIADLLKVMRERLEPFGLSQSIALATPEGKSYEYERALELVPLTEALSCDLLCDHRYNTPARVVEAFGKSMLIDIDPGQLQVAIEIGTYNPQKYGSYFTIGEWAKFIKKHKPHFKTHGHHWIYTPPPVALEQWPVVQAAVGSPMTTVSNWFMDNEWMPDEKGDYYDNSKRAAFQPFMQIPRQSPIPLELCINLGGYQPEKDLLNGLGWGVRESRLVSHPLEYRKYIQNSYGEFSCAKPSYVKLKTGWLSDRTACYLASGKPVVIQKTGPSDIFPDSEGMFRFGTLPEAIKSLQSMSCNYAHHAAAARKLAEEYLDARKVLADILERVV